MFAFFCFIIVCCKLSNILSTKTSEEFYVLVKDDVESPESYGLSFSPNVSANFLRLRFQTPQMLTVDEIFDFSRDIRFSTVTVPGEVALGEPVFQTFHFLTRLGDLTILPPDAIAKLRQKKPKLVRIGEEDKGDEQVSFTLSVPMSLAPPSVEAAKVASGIFVNEEDFRTLFDEGFNVNVVHLSTWLLPRCNTVADANKPCQCELKMRLSWYPCGWMKCPTSNNNQTTTAFSFCGIKSCRSSRRFLFEVPKKLNCGWDN